MELVAPAGSDLGSREQGSSGRLDLDFSRCPLHPSQMLQGHHEWRGKRAAQFLPAQSPRGRSNTTGGAAQGPERTGFAGWLDSLLGGGKRDRRSSAAAAVYPGLHTCGICGRHFKTAPYLDRHLQSTHAADGEAADGSACLADFCPFLGCWSNEPAVLSLSYNVDGSAEKGLDATTEGQAIDGWVAGALEDRALSLLLPRAAEVPADAAVDSAAESEPEEEDEEEVGDEPRSDRPNADEATGADSLTSLQPRSLRRRSFPSPAPPLVSGGGGIEQTGWFASLFLSSSSSSLRARREAPIVGDSSLAGLADAPLLPDLSTILGIGPLNRRQDQLLRTCKNLFERCLPLPLPVPEPGTAKEKASSAPSDAGIQQRRRVEQLRYDLGVEFCVPFLQWVLGLSGDEGTGRPGGHISSIPNAALGAANVALTPVSLVSQAARNNAGSRPKSRGKGAGSDGGRRLPSEDNVPGTYENAVPTTVLGRAWRWFMSPVGLVIGFISVSAAAVSLFIALAVNAADTGSMRAHRAPSARKLKVDDVDGLDADISSNRSQSKDEQTPRGMRRPVRPHLAIALSSSTEDNHAGSESYDASEDFYGDEGEDMQWPGDTGDASLSGKLTRRRMQGDAKSAAAFRREALRQNQGLKAEAPQAEHRTDLFADD
jgi:hypothetical protein